MSLPPRLDQAYVDGLLSLVASSGETTSSATEPYTGEPLPAVPQSSADRRRRCRRPRPSRAGGLGRAPARRAGGHRAALRQAHPPAPRAAARRGAVGDRQVAGARHDRAARPAGGRGALRHPRAGLPRRDEGDLRHARDRAHPRRPPAQGPDRRDRALELPAVPGRRRRHPRAARRQRRAEQGRLAGSAEPARRPGAGRRGRPARRRVAGRGRPRLRGRLRRSSTPSTTWPSPARRPPAATSLPSAVAG